MDDSRILIVGAYGQLGKALQLRYPKAIAVDRDTFDMTNEHTIETYDWANIDIIINAAAYTKVDEAETLRGREAAWNINAVGPSYLSRVAQKHELTVVHISSEYVFDGTKSPHTETEHFTPLSVYGQSKAAGDIAIAINSKHYIVRTSWLIGDGANFVRTMINVAHKGVSPTVVADQIGRLTFTPTLVDAIDHLLTTKAAYGTYNVSNNGEPASWATVTRAIFSALGLSNLRVTDITTAKYFANKSVAPRPLQSAFDLQKILATGLVLTDWHGELINYVTKENRS